MPKEFVKIAGVKFRNAGRIYYYYSNDLELRSGDKVIVSTPIGLGMGEVIIEPTLVPKEKSHAYNILAKKFDTDYVLANLSPATLDGSIDSEPKVPETLENIIRKANKEDIKAQNDNLELAQKEHNCCLKLIKEKKLPMKLVKTEISQNAKKIVFYFTSNSRVDFRDLVKDLLKELKMRIELRQIDLRDETKIMGGIGCCGKTLCCSTFLRQFKPVSIKMAKEQNLALNPAKVSGVCGRLLCCLAYEMDTYTEMKKELPKIGRRVNTPEGEGKVIKVDIFSKRLDVLLDGGGLVHVDMGQIKELRDQRSSGQQQDNIILSDQSTTMGESVSEAELRALEDPDEVIDIKDTFIKQVKDSRKPWQSGHQQRPNQRNNQKDHQRQGQGQSNRQGQGQGQRQNQNQGPKQNNKYNKK
jgi:cell fate regulator YaaT (PSP1 superfamily)